MRRTIIAYTTLLALALVAAYLSWTADPDTSKEEGVVLLDVEADAIETIQYVSDDIDVMLTAREDERGRYLWAKVITREQQAPEPEPKPEPKPDPEPAGESGESGDAGADTGEGSGEGGQPEPEPEPEPKPEPTRVSEAVVEAVTHEFVAGSAGDELLKDLAPMTAKRSLDAVSPEKLEEFGLAESPARLTIGIVGREPVSYEVGDSGFGSGIMYLRDSASGQVYVFDAKVLAPLTKADKRLPNRSLFAAKPEEIVAAEVRAEGRAATLEHRNREDADRQYWADEGVEGGDETAQAWLQKFFRLRASGYVAESEQPRAPQTRFEVVVIDAEGARTSVEVLSGEGPDGEQRWYARSEHTRGLVELSASLAEETAQDISSVLE